MAMQFPQTGSPIGDFGSNPLARLVTKERRLSAPPCRSCTNQRRTAVRTRSGHLSVSPAPGSKALVSSLPSAGLVPNAERDVCELYSEWEN